MTWPRQRVQSEKAQEGGLKDLGVQQESRLGLQRRQRRSQTLLQKLLPQLQFLKIVVIHNKQPMESKLVKAFLYSSFI